MSNLESQMKRIFEAYVSDQIEPGIVVGLIKKGKLIFHKGYGYANIEHQAPLTSATPFYLASVSKAFTATALLLLEEQGDVSLSDHITAYFPKLSDMYASITVQQLLHHTSGLPDYLNYYGKQKIPYHWQTNADVLAYLYQHPPLDFMPGDKYQYSNSGYALLASLVEIIAEEGFGSFLNRQIFEPLGMVSTQVFDKKGLIVPAKAYSYEYDATEGRYMSNDYTLLTMGDGGIFSTLEDMYLWDQALYPGRFFSKRVLGHMFTPGFLNDGTQHHYAGGWFVKKEGGKTVIHHSGGLCGYRNHFIRHVDEEASFIMLSNCRRDALEGILEKLPEVLRTV